jgi:hypothetical protein
LETLAEPLRLGFTCEVPHYITEAGGLLVFKPGQLISRTTHEHPETRVHPLVFDFKGSSQEDIKIVLPEGYQLQRLPDSAMVQSNFGEFKVDYEQLDGLLSYKRELSRTAERISSAEYSSYLRFVNEIAMVDQTQVILEKM